MGASMDWTDRGLRAKAAHLHGIDIDCSQIPDLLPILAATASVAEGETRLHSAARVRLKESDRIAVSAAALERLGIETVQDTDSLTIFGGSPSGAQVDGANDHRIVMAFSILGSRIPGIYVTDAKAIGKSYKAFFEDYNRLGGGARLEDE